MIDIIIPNVGESITEVTLLSWQKKEGDLVERDEVIAEVESEKASFEISAEKTGILHISVEEDTTIAIGAVIGTIDETKAASKKVQKRKKAVSNPPKNKEQLTPPHKRQTTTPLAKAIIKKEGVDISYIQPTSNTQKITKIDVLNKIKQHATKLSRSDRITTSKKMSILRKTISKRLVEAKNNTAMLTTFNEADMTAIMDIRAKYKEKFKEVHGVGLGFMSFFTKACCIALEKFPSVNAYIDNDQTIMHNYCDISIAVSTPKGLVVPVIRDADALSMEEIEKQVIHLASKARDGKLSMEDMDGGTFTITNGGVFGSLLSTPIINPPQSAILGMHKIEDRPVVINHKIVVRKMMYLALSYDHRIIDGKESVSFLVTVKSLLENPESLIAGKPAIELLLDL